MPQCNDARDFARMIQELPRSARQVLVEGDSWVAHPFLANLAIQLDQLGKGDFAILNLARPGDTARRMLARRGREFKELSRLIVNEEYGYRWDFIFLSAAGNDIVGEEIDDYVDAKGSGAHGKDLLNENYFKRVAEIARDYADLIAFRDASQANPTTPIVTHAYSYLTPRRVGTKVFGAMLGDGWIQRYLQPKGIVDPEEQKEIVRAMLDAYHDALKALERPGNNFLVVDTRAILSRAPSEPNPVWWHDEIHPNYAGFKRVAGTIRAAMKTAGYWPE